LLAERGYHVDEHIVTADFERPNEAALFPEVDGYGIVVLMGSVRSLTATDEISNWVFEELDIVRQAHANRKPMLGVCFGGQVLAAALGGSVEPAPETEIGWYEIFEPNGTSPASAGQAQNPLGAGPWFQWHHDRFTPPPGAEILAINDNAVQLFRIDRSVGTQFHPEVTHEHLKGFLSEAKPEYVTEHGINPEQMLAEMCSHEQRNARQCEHLVDWFLNEVATS